MSWGCFLLVFPSIPLYNLQIENLLLCWVHHLKTNLQLCVKDPYVILLTTNIAIKLQEGQTRYMCLYQKGTKATLNGRHPVADLNHDSVKIPQKKMTPPGIPFFLVLSTKQMAIEVSWLLLKMLEQDPVVFLYFLSSPLLLSFFFIYSSTFSSVTLAIHIIANPHCNWNLQ